jgi:hypothetical protein
MFVGDQNILSRELAWFGIAGPIFGFACAFLAKSCGRRQWVWFILGFVFTVPAVLILLIFYVRKSTKIDHASP